MHRRPLDRIERNLFDQVLEFFGKTRLTAADRPEQVKNLLLFLQPLRSMAEIGDDVLDHLFHAVQIAKRRIASEHFVGEDARQTMVGARIDCFRFANGQQHAFGNAGIGGAITFA